MQEIHDLHEANREEVAKEDRSTSAIMLRHAALERDKRCLLAYLNHRAEKIREMRWQFGAILPPDVKVKNFCDRKRLMYLGTKFCVFCSYLVRGQLD